MTGSEFFDSTVSGEWTPVGKFSGISSLVDGEREFLEAIHRFKVLEASGLVPEVGFEMPKLRGLDVGKVNAVDIVADNPIGAAQGVSDGIIMVRQVR